MIVLDTCALIWRSFEEHRLSPTALKAINNSREIIISTISIWEIGIKVKNGRLTLPFSIEEFVERLRKVENLKMISVDAGIWVESLKLDWQHRDPADRVIVATAKKMHIPLVTEDKLIRKFYKKSIW